MENAIRDAKDLIRSKNPIQTRFTPLTGPDRYEHAHIIGFGRDVGSNPLTGPQMRELIDHGFAYPFTGDIRVTFAEFLLDEEMIDAVEFVKHGIGRDVIYKISDKRQQFLIHMVHDLGFIELSKMKAFVKHVRDQDWELATSELLGYESPMGRNALL